MILGEKISGGSSWSKDDDIVFERALAIYNDGIDNSWEKIAAVVPGKTVDQIREHYEILLHDVMMIESGRVPLPDYDISEEAIDKEKSIRECGINRICCGYEQEAKPTLKQQRRKGIAWTADEHRLFLLGLDKFGKGDWRSISRNFVVTRTPTQVASHAQKYFARINSKNKGKKRPSIHDENVAAGSRINLPTMQRTTWQTTQPIKASTSQPSSLDHTTFGASTTWSTPPTSQPSLSLPRYEASTMWNRQAALQPSLDRTTYGTPTTPWNTPATPQPTLSRPLYGAPAMCNTQAGLQPSVNMPTYGTPTISLPTAGPMYLPSGSDMNRLTPPCMTYGVQLNPVPYSLVPSAPSFSMGSAPYNMAYLPNSR
ncbi:unnamed protein product [Thlaspi arvense]|uniref:Uncharacterized protein n=1 Tax=Thlaspi arvense TaxID=13288 RepID=A0AAU9RN33_THLAR|nr:unnamed protein product [Thlaspi arvense]